MKTERLIENFISKYGPSQNEISIYFSPGRVNLIGEHTDYNGGFVFPCTLTYGTFLAVRDIKPGLIRFASVNFDYYAEIPLNELSEKVDSEWVNYPLGVIAEFRKTGVKVTGGSEFLYSGDIPNGAGLSSSASIETVTAMFINEKFGNNKLGKEDLAKLCQRAENNFVGVNCGIMDQFSALMGKENHAIFLNCETLEYELVPLELANYRLIISNTNKKRQLADSKYNERRGECDQAVSDLNKIRPVKNLGKLNLDEFEKLADNIPDATVRKRARHVVSEDQRCLDAIDALKKGNLEEFGSLMNSSHDSLRDDYEVTGIELDTLVDEARKINGVVGSRMTGAGFGGCTVSVVHTDSIEKFISNVGTAYTAKTGLKADFYLASVGTGTHKITS
jgi:galactokinase